MEHFSSTLAIVIKSRNLRESDLNLTLLTPNLGKITVFAKGAKNIRSRRLGTLQLGNIIKAQLYQQNGRYWLSESVAINSFLQNRKNLTQLNLLFYFLEILNYLIADNQQIDGIYDISHNLIAAIRLNRLDRFIFHEIEFAKLLGFGIPDTIDQLYSQADYIGCQHQLKTLFESIIEHPLKSHRLFS